MYLNEVMGTFAIQSMWKVSVKKVPEARDFGDEPDHQPCEEGPRNTAESSQRHDRKGDHGEK